MQRVLLAVYDDGVAGVGTACIAHHILCIFGKVIYNLAFSFITPLGTDNNDLHKKSPHKVLYGAILAKSAIIVQRMQFC